MKITINLYLELEEEEIDEYIIDFATSDFCKDNCKSKRELTDYIIQALCRQMETDITYPSDVHIEQWHICDDAADKIANGVWLLWQLQKKQ